MEQIEVQKQKEYMEKVKNININKNLKYYILTMGCSLNENDSEKICGMLETMCYTKTENQDEADIIIFNTCCIRENAEDKLFGKLGEVKRVREKNGAIIAIGGCMMQEKHILEKLNKSYPYVDIVFGTHTLHKLPEDIYNILENNKRVEDVLDIDGNIYEGLPIKRTDDVKAQVTIMYGCNNFCSYCIVPYVRGRERSRKKEDILNEIECLAKNGYKEIMLLGQNVNSYNGGEGYNFANLLTDINKIDGIEIIRFISPHPKDFTDDVIEAIANSSKVSKCIHLPLQSGSTKVLKSMNRKYTKEQFLEVASKLKNADENISLSTDIIVGFPNETEEEFLDTLDVVEKVKFDQIYMFIYSKRNGTIAAKMEDKISSEEKVQRLERLKKVYELYLPENNAKMIGKVYKVLVEGKSKNNDKLYTGRTSQNKVVIFEGNDNLIGNIVNVKIDSQHLWYLKGKIL